MARAITGTVHKKRAKTILKRTKGYRGTRSKNFRVAKGAMMKALSAAYVGRKLKKRDFRTLWIARINGACRNLGISYSKFIHGLKILNIELDRKTLSDMAITNIAAFTQLVEQVKAAQK